MQSRNKLELVQEEKARMTNLNKKEDAELSAGASRATTPQKLRDQQTPSTKCSKTYLRSASSIAVKISPEDMGGWT